MHCCYLPLYLQVLAYEDRNSILEKQAQDLAASLADNGAASEAAVNELKSAQALAEQELAAQLMAAQAEVEALVAERDAATQLLVRGLKYYFDIMPFC